MSTDMRLDASDPLDLLLQNAVGGDASTSDDSGASSVGSPQDWTQLSTLWDGTDPTAVGVKYNEMMDFNDLNGTLDMNMNMEMEFDPTMGLHYGGYGAFDDTSAFNLQLEPFQAQFPFSFQAALNGAGTSNPSSSASSFSSGASTSSASSQRRLSVGSTASASSSGASREADTSNANSPSTFSPPPQPATPKVEVKAESPQAFDPAMEIAERVRQSAGVMLAVPMNGQYVPQPFDNSMPHKIPIPRLTPNSPHSSSSSAASTPPPATPPHPSALPSKLTINTKPSSSALSSSLPTPTTAMPTPSSSTAAPGARPKTSHTTIERRYRTNLNARIQSLRMAVPALRVLEDREGGNGKKIKKNLKDGVYLKGAGIGIDGANGTIDVIDERGFVDGVKVARKCSKANVLGKAVEYIRVLKKRELRLKAEQNGLKALLCGLVGGPALLKEWETRWRERLGGEERDEVEGEEAEPEEDSDEDEDGDDGEVGKKRKRAKTAASGTKAVFDKKTHSAAAVPPPPHVANVITQLGGTAPGVNGAPVVPEKRKRGRPRKVPVAPAPVTTHAPQVSPQDILMQNQDQIMLGPPIELHQQGAQPQQYLLAVFALFSFFNSPLTSFSSWSSSATAHQHTGVLLNRPPLALAPEIISQFTPLPEQSAAVVVGWTWREWTQGLHLAVSLFVLGSLICTWMGVSLSMKRSRKADTEGEKGGLRRLPDGRVDWMGVCHDIVANGTYKSLSTSATIRMYTSILTTTPRSIPQLTSAALLLYSKGGILFTTLTRAKARSLWSTAKAHSNMPLPPSAKKGGPVTVQLYERLVLESWTVEEAAKHLFYAREAEQTTATPIEVLAGVLVKQRVKGHLGWLFVDAVGSSESQDKEKVEKMRERMEQERSAEEMEMRRTIEAARELGGDVEELGRILERVWKQPANLFLDDLSESFLEVEEVDEIAEGEDVVGSEVLDQEIKALLTGLVLYRRVFGVHKGGCGPISSVASALISPPPSPSSTIRPGVRPSSGSPKERNVLLDLRRALGSRVFEDDTEQEREDAECDRLMLEDARDRVVDLVVDMERRGRSASP